MTDLLAYHPVTWSDRLLLDCHFATPEQAHSVAIRHPLAKPPAVISPAPEPKPAPAKPKPKPKPKKASGYHKGTVAYIMAVAKARETFTINDLATSKSSRAGLRPICHQLCDQGRLEMVTPAVALAWGRKKPTVYRRAGA